MIASLGMYDMPALQPANDRLWQGIRAALAEETGEDGPETLTRDADLFDIWTDPGLLLAQTCGMPFRTRLQGKVTLVATPDYGLPDCDPGYYRSVLVVRADAPGETEADFMAGTMAYNDALSQSGWAAPATHLAGLGLTPAHLLRTGGHAASVHAVAEGRADIAGVDAQTWRLLQLHDPATAGLRVLAQTAATPGLPLITAAGRDPAPLRAALRRAIAGLSAEDRATLHLRGIVEIPADAYLAVPTPPAP